MKKHPNSKMIEGMEALRQMASTSLFLQNEKNNCNNMVSTIQEDGNSDRPLEMKRIEDDDDDIDVFNLSDSEDNDVLVKLGTEIPSTSQLKSIQKTSENSNNISGGSGGGGGGVSFLMKPIQLERPIQSQSSSSSASSSQQQARISKLSRTRAPVNQQKSKEPECTTETSLMTLDASQVTKSNEIPSSTYASTTISLAPSVPSPSFTQFNSNGGNPFRETTSVATTSQSIPLKPIIQDGSTKLTIVQPANASNVTSANSSNITSSFEPELVLSPAKLGQ